MEAPDRGEKRTPPADTSQLERSPDLFPAALVVRFELGRSSELLELVEQKVGAEREELAGAFFDKEEASTLRDDLRPFFDAALATIEEGLKEDGQTYVALTTRTLEEFFERAAAEGYLPGSEIPTHHHIRAVLPVDADNPDAVGRGLESAFEKHAEETAVDWRIKAGADHLLVDLVTPIARTAGEANDRKPPENLFERVIRFEENEPPETPAMIDFARSEGDAGIYVDPMRLEPLVGVISARRELAQTLETLSSHSDAELRSMHDETLRSNWQGALGEILSRLDGGLDRRPELADVSATFESDEEGFSGRIIATHTEMGAELAEETRGAEIALDELPDGAVVASEASVDIRGAEKMLPLFPWAQRRGSSRGVNRPPSTPILHSHVYGSWGHLLLRQPMKLAVTLTNLVRVTGTSPPFAYRFALYSGAEDEADEGDEPAYRMAFVGAYPDTAQSRSQVDEGLHQLDDHLESDLDWRIESRGDHLLVRAAEQHEIDEIFTETTAKSTPKRLFMRGDPGALGEWAASTQSHLKQIVHPVASKIVDEPMVVRLDSKKGHSAVHLRGEASAALPTPRLPPTPHATNAPLASCPIGHSSIVDEFHQAPPTTPERRFEWVDEWLEVLSHRADPCVDKGTSTIVARQMWLLGLRGEENLQLRSAARFFEAGCEFGDELSCEGLSRVEKAASIEAWKPSLTVDPHPLPWTGLAGTWLSVDASERVWFADEAIGELGEANLADALGAGLSDGELEAPLDVLSLQPEQAARAQNMIGLVAAAQTDTARLASALADLESVDQRTFYATFSRSAGESYARMSHVPFAVRAVPLTDAADSDQIRVYVRDEGIEIVDRGEAIEPVDDCAQDGPTICEDEQVFDVMPRIDDWVQAERELVIVPDGDISWRRFVELAFFLQRPGNGVWGGPSHRHRRFRAAPYEQVLLAVPDEREE